MNEYLFFWYNPDGSLYCVVRAEKEKRNREQMLEYFRHYCKLEGDYYLISKTDKDWDQWYKKYITFKNK
jgi:hypothetical protein